MKYNIGLLSAMPEEIGLTLKYLENLEKTSYGSLEIFSGNWIGLESKGIEVNIITAWSGWGKVNAAYETTRLIAQANRQKLDLDLILFTGVAGAVDEGVEYSFRVTEDKFALGNPTLVNHKTYHYNDCLL